MTNENEVKGMEQAIDPAELGVAVYVSLQQMGEDKFLKKGSVKWSEAYDRFVDLITSQGDVSRIVFVIHRLNLKQAENIDRVEVTVSNNKESIITKSFIKDEVVQKEIPIQGKGDELLNAATLTYAKLITGVLQSFTISEIIIEKEGS